MRKHGDEQRSLVAHRVKALATALVAAVIGTWALYHGYPEVAGYWKSAESMECEDFLAGDRPSALGKKIELRNCLIDTQGMFGEGLALANDADVLLLPLLPSQSSATWELAVETENEELLDEVNLGDAAIERRHDFVGVLQGVDGDDFREAFRLRRKRAVVFLVEATTFGMLVGLALCALAAVMLLAALGGLFIAATGYEP